MSYDHDSTKRGYMSHPTLLYPHQQDALQRLDNGKILWGGVGTGKSLVAAAYYAEKESPKDVYVITTAKKRDSVEWEGEFAKYGTGKSLGTTTKGVLTVDSWNNIGKYRKVKEAFFIFDEQRLVGSGTWVASFVEIAKANRWILLTATPGDNWLDYIPVFIANGFYKTRTEFKREHVVYKSYSKFPKVERYTGLGSLVRHRNSLLVEMPYLRHTVRHSTNIPVEFDKELFNKVVKRKWHVYEYRPLKNIAELFLVMRKVVNSDSSRLKAVLELLSVHPRLIVFYNFDYELNLLRGLTSLLNSLENPIQTLNNIVIHPSNSKRIDKECQIQLGVNTTSSPLDSMEILTKHSYIVPAVTQSCQKKNSLDCVTNKTPHMTLGVEFQIAEWNDGKSISTTSSHSESEISTIDPKMFKSFSVAEWNGHKHEAIPETESWLYLVQYSAGAEGWNCTSTNAMIFYSLTYSYKLWHQAHGRIDRLNTDYSDLYYYTLMSDSVIDKAIAECLSNKKSFNESGYMRSKPS